MTRETFRTLTALRHTVRSIALGHRLPADDRARLVLSLSEVAAPVLGGGRPVTLLSGRETDEDGAHRLTLALRLPQQSAGADVVPDRLPLRARARSDGTVVWNLPLPPTGAHGQPVPTIGQQASPSAAARSSEADIALLEEELRAALARADALADEHRMLKHELAETNSGVLALYVQLEERDEQLRTAHGRTLRALEDALRPRPLHVDGLELAVHYAPASDEAPTGGDLYDWFTLPDGTVHITVVDALGHGITSTRTALTVTHAVRTLALEGHPLESIVARTDSVLAPFDQSVMATLLLARLNLADGQLTLANGSHPPALLAHGDGTASYLEVRGRGIGFPMPGSDRVLTATMEPDDVLLLYTDGLTESRRDPCEGEARLKEALCRHRARPTEQIPGLLAEDLLSDVLHQDDTLAIAVRRTGA
ncbi:MULTISPECIES: PP2C family protein-serine/threonine phosphatase [unclassified Streptomyces]|uniref:PP2C family protein-serine/threonine phosphatase n=1 Tax=unclassified Streptomyces TaxID=2593676 RepID=UPI001CBDCBD7|nr:MULTISPECIES: PP2C family protein-serine/threonine phosphatase [unclassified Streptomyces]WPO75491.1 PP2C family protein-serine/threonine phosphatase [Streptomyces sp. KN37]